MDQLWSRWVRIEWLDSNAYHSNKLTSCSNDDDDSFGFLPGTGSLSSVCHDELLDWIMSKTSRTATTLNCHLNRNIMSKSILVDSDEFGDFEEVSDSVIASLIVLAKPNLIRQLFRLMHALKESKVGIGY